MTLLFDFYRFFLPAKILLVSRSEFSCNITIRKQTTDWRLSKPPKPNKNISKSLTYRVFMIVTKMAFISIQTVGQTISNSLQTLRKADANALQTLSNSFQTLYKLLSNGLETPLRCFQTLCKLLPNPFKNVSNFFQTLCKPFANASQMPFQGV